MPYNMLWARLATFWALMLLIGPRMADADITAGRFGGGLDVSIHRGEAPVRPEYAALPMTAECWVKLSDMTAPNVLLSHGSKFRPLHWELTVLPDGRLMAAFTGYEPSMVDTPGPFADGQWHHVALTMTDQRVRLSIDGRVALEKEGHRTDSRAGLSDERGQFFVGHYYPQYLFCKGVIDEIRLSSCEREFASLPDKPYEVDSATVALWHCDEEIHDGDDLADASRLKVPVRVLSTFDEHDRHAFGVTRTLFDRPCEPAEWVVGPIASETPALGAGAQEVLLDGRWDCVQEDGVTPDARKPTDPSAWTGAFACEVPGTIHTALLNVGKIADPWLLKNNLDQEWVAKRVWWLRRTFPVPAEWRGRRVRLCFDGVDYGACFFLNGKELGSHRGMWGGPDFEVTDSVRFGEDNVVVVRLDPAPEDFTPVMKNSVSYGWHYVRLVTSGLWRSVRLQARGDGELGSPLLGVAAVESERARVRLHTTVRHNAEGPGSYALEARLTPRNFTGPTYRLTRRVEALPGLNEVDLEGTLEGVRLWWPVDLGDPNLYTFECMLRRGDEVVDRYASTWGARTIEMKLADGEVASGSYKWQFVVNGRPVWVKGANWCYPDCLLRLDANRQRRFLELARDAHIQMLRVWGGGPVENDAFYNLCDELGLMTQQEFAVMGQEQPYMIKEAEATEAATREVVRLRNRPSVAMWCGSNEADPAGPVFGYLGKVCHEQDGTRPFHRTSPMGGDWHWYSVGPGQEPLLNYRGFCEGRVAIGEAGLASPPSLETLKRVLPAEELTAWPIARDSAFVHHTPTFEYRHVEIFERYARDFLDPKDLPSLVKGAQLGQAWGLKFLIESMRARKPRTTAAYIYKLTENYPASSWATIDAYGYPKPAHYYVRQANAPIRVMSTFASWDSRDGKLALPLSIVNDTLAPVQGTIRARLFDGRLQLAGQEDREAEVPTDRAFDAGTVEFAVSAEVPRPLFVCLTFSTPSGEVDRNWYSFDFAATKGSLFDRPATTLQATVNGQELVVTNTGEAPAVSVEFSFGEAGNTYYTRASCLWLDAGESRTVGLAATPAVDGRTALSGRCVVGAWNAPPVTVEFPRSIDPDVEHPGTRIEPVPTDAGAMPPPGPRYRLRCSDKGVVMRHGNGPQRCDELGARDVWVWAHDGTYYMHYDGAGPKGWLACLAVSRDLEHWEKRGPVLDLGPPGALDSGTASYGTTYFDGTKWHMFYLATPRVSNPPDLVPIGPYYTMKAEADNPEGPWRKASSFRSFDPTPQTGANAGPGQVLRQGDEYWMFFTGLGLARARSLDGPWKVDLSIRLPQEGGENTSLYHEPATDTWFLFTNHIGAGYTDAVWVYWTKDLTRWNPDHKALVLDGATCSWSKTIIGLPSVVPVGNRLAMLYDGNPDPEDRWHLGRDIGLAWIDLPLRTPEP